MTHQQNITQKALRMLKTSIVEADCDLSRATLHLPATYCFAHSTDMTRYAQNIEYTVSSKQSGDLLICPPVMGGSR